MWPHAIDAVCRSLLVAEVHRETGHHKEALERYEELIGRGSAKDPELFLQAALALADLDYVCGRLERSRRRLENILEQRSQFEQYHVFVRVHRNIGHIHLAAEKAVVAAESYELSLRQALQAGEPYLVSEAHNSLGEALIDSRPESAEANVRIAMEYAERAEGPVEYAKGLYMLAQIHLKHGDYDRALATSEEALGLNQSIGYQSGVARSHLVLAEAHYALGDREAAVRFALQADQYYLKEEIYPWLRALALRIARSASSGTLLERQVEATDSFDRIPNQEEFPSFNRTYTPNRLR
jgi:tetratricopeptide (TPR) repeat protein